MLHTLRRLLLYPSFIIANVGCLFAVSIAFDGCTKCYLDSNEERWALAASSAWLWIWPYLLVMSWIGFKLLSARPNAQSTAPLILAALAGTVFYAGLSMGDVARALRCGKDCLPALPIASVFSTLSATGTIFGLIGMFVGYFRYKSSVSKFASEPHRT